MVAEPALDRYTARRISLKYGIGACRDAFCFPRCSRSATYACARSRNVLVSSALFRQIWSGGFRIRCATQLQIENEPRRRGGSRSTSPLWNLLLDTIDYAHSRSEERANDLAAVGISCFWHSLLGLDEFGEPITPVYFWGDTRSAHQVTALRSELDVVDVHQRTGCITTRAIGPRSCDGSRKRAPPSAPASSVGARSRTSRLGNSMGETTPHWQWPPGRACLMSTPGLGSNYDHRLWRRS